MAMVGTLLRRNDRKYSLSYIINSLKLWHTLIKHIVVMDFERYEGGVAMTSDVLARRRHNAKIE